MEECGEINRFITGDLNAKAGLRLLRAFLLDRLDLVDEVIGLLEEAGALLGGLHHIGLAAIEQVQVGHGVVVIGLDLNGFLEVGDAFIHERAILCSVLGAQRRRKWIGVSDLLGDMILVVSGAHLAIGAKRQRPINHADPVVWLGIIGTKLDVFLMIRLRFLKLLGIVGLASHLKEDGADAVDGANIVRIDLQDFFEFIDGGVAEAHVLFRRRARNVLAGISSGQIEAGVHQIRIKLLGFLEIVDGCVVEAVLVSANTFIEEVAGLQFAATGDACDKEQERRKGGSSLSEPRGRGLASQPG